MRVSISGDLERIADADHIDLTVDPPPDLAIEIEITQSALQRMSIYAALGVPELWRYDGRILRVMIRHQDGGYRESERSLAFPSVPMDQLADFASREETRDENLSSTSSLGGCVPGSISQEMRLSVP